LEDPVPVAVHRALRGAVLDLKTRHRTLSFPPEIQVSRSQTPTGRWIGVHEVTGNGLSAHRSLAVAGLEVDVMRALVPQPSEVWPHNQETWIWLARPGALAWHDLDAVWLAAATLAHEEAGLEFTMAVITKQGWYDPRSGCSRSWKRLRVR
jgi:hypothetical protein